MSIKAELLPRHVAIIMDGNGRWAKQHCIVVALGHRKGVEALRSVVRYASDIGIQVLSIFAFSTENWNRPQREVSALMALILEFFASEIDELHGNDVQIRILGEKSALPDAQRQAVTAAEERTKNNKGLQLNIALNYGARDELLRAARALAREVQSGTLKPEEITASHFEAYLDTAGQPDVDLLIRTSGEMRLSNFLLYQNAYAELCFPSVLWPDFDQRHFQEALQAFAARDRRFGGRNT